MIHPGACRCKAWRVRVILDAALSTFNPRRCDCAYCQSHPSALLSSPAMRAELTGALSDRVTNRNGDELADFHHCKICGDLLTVTREFDGTLRGAVNALLLDERDSLGASVPIQPRLLSAQEKVARWKKLWGEVRWLS